MTSGTSTETDAARFQPLDRVLLLGATVSPFLLLYFHHRYLWVVAPPLGFLLLYFWFRRFAPFVQAAFWPMFFVGLLVLPWPLNFVVPLCAYLFLYACWPRFRHANQWLVVGRFNKTVLAWMVPTICLTSGGLLAWVSLFHPNLSDLARMVPQGGPMVLIGVGVLFSVFNAIWEEFILKGIAWNSLAAIFKRDWMVNTGQAALFGIMHIGGFPRGWVGVLMTTLYGLVLGVIRKESRGLLAPIVAHIFADATIFLIIYFLSTGYAYAALMTSYNMRLTAIENRVIIRLQDGEN